LPEQGGSQSGFTKTSGEGEKVAQKVLGQLIRDEEGATALEYSLMAAAVAGVIVVVAFLLGGKAYNSLNRVASHIN
jgi:Flp pilus assembly pilin Flp